MKSLILAAGYGTRLYPLTETTAKPLLPLAGKPIIEYLLQQILPLSAIDKVYIVTNGKFYKDFEEWLETFEGKRKKKDPPIHILNDGSTSNENRLGAIRDMALTVETFGIDDDLMVSAADDVFTFDFQNLVNIFQEKGKTIITLHPSNDPDMLRNSGNAQIDSRGRVVSLIEKPSSPKSNLISPCLYILSRPTLPSINHYLQADNNPDAPGHFLAWLVEKTVVYSYIFKEPYYTVGDKTSYERAQSLFDQGEKRRNIK